MVELYDEYIGEQAELTTDEHFNICIEFINRYKGV